MQIKIQQFTSKCIRNIVEASNRNDNNNVNEDGNWKTNHSTNKQIRITYGIPTIESRIFAEKLCDIYRRYATKSSTYLNNSTEYDMDINQLNRMIRNKQGLINSKNKNDVLTQNEQKQFDDLRAFRNNENQPQTILQLLKTKTPINTMQINYKHFKNLTKTVYESTTRHEEHHTRDERQGLACPTCGKICYSTGWLTTHRKHNPACIAEYQRELEQMKICTNNECGKIFATHNDMIKHREYHCEQEENKYHNHSADGVIDRRAPFGFGIPNNNKRIFGDKADFNATTQTWNCLICNFKRGKYQRYQVFGHIAATHGYTSRIPNERWGIPIDEKIPGGENKQHLQQ